MSSFPRSNISFRSVQWMLLVSISWFSAFLRMLDWKSFDSDLSIYSLCEIMFSSQSSINLVSWLSGPYFIAIA